MLKQIIIPILIIAVAVLAFIGSYKPLAQGSMYIEANRGPYNSVSQIIDSFEEVFEYPSPIGHEETVKFFYNNVLSIVSSNQVQSQEVADKLINYAESKVVEDNFLHYLSLANLYNLAWQKFGIERYYEKTEEYYLKAHNMGPNVPQPLHNLFDIYRKKGETQKMEEIADKILKLWPEYEDLEGLKINLR